MASDVVYKTLWYDYEARYGSGLRLQVTGLQLLPIVSFLSLATGLLVLRLLHLREKWLKKRPFQVQLTADSKSDLPPLWPLFEQTEKPKWKRVLRKFIYAVVPFLIAGLAFFLAPRVLDGGMWGVPLMEADCAREPRGVGAPEVASPCPHQARMYEARVGEYVDRCYENSNSQPFNGKDPLCETLGRKSIPFQEQDKALCPIRDSSACYLGEDSAFMLDTGFQPASMLGINSKSKFLFRRRLVGVPLAINGTSSLTEVSYDYGPIYKRKMFPIEEGDLWASELLDEYTMRKDIGDDNLSDPYQYDYQTATSVFGEGYGWSPRAEYAHSRLDSQHVAQTLVFVHGGELIKYEEPQLDPIYPASFGGCDDEDDETDESVKYCRKVEWGTVLSLVEQQGICLARTGMCWTSFSSPENFDESILEAENTFYESLTSDEKAVFNTLFHNFKASLAWRYFAPDLHGRQTIANRAVMNGKATYSSDNVWKKDVRKAFEWTLSRLQHTIQDTAYGKTYVKDYETQAIEDQKQFACGRGFIKTRDSLTYTIHVPTLIFTMFILGSLVVWSILAGRLIDHLPYSNSSLSSMEDLKIIIYTLFKRRFNEDDKLTEQDQEERSSRGCICYTISFIFIVLVAQALIVCVCLFNYPTTLSILGESARAFEVYWLHILMIRYGL